MNMTELKQKGFWEPHTSSIDFCETNYELTSSIAEFHNTWSSLVGISLFGLIGLLYGNKTNEWRFRLAYFILFAIGIGSAGLHGTLHWIFQSSDELPMIYLVAALVYNVVEIDSPISKPHFPRLPILMMILMIVNTYVYYVFQQLYWVFIATYSIGTTLYAVMAVKRIYLNKKGGQVVKKLCRMNLYNYLLIGFPLWIVDMTQCEWYHENFPNVFGLTFHIVWHWTAGFGTYCGIVALEYTRLMELDLGPYCSLHYLLGIVPVISTKPKTS